MAVVKIFFDTSVLLPAIIDFGPQSHAPIAIFEAIAAGRLKGGSTAWHCCLELFSVATRLPEEFRLSPAEATELVRHEILDRLQVHVLPARMRSAFFETALIEGISGGRIYDTHIAEIGRASGAEIVVTENRRDFITLLRHEIRVLTAAEFLRESNL